MTTIEINTHYGRGNLEETILTGLNAAGVVLENLAPGDLAPVDQFHMGGRDATLELLQLARLGEGLEILDVGGGLGGAARVLALEIGASVTVLDATKEFCRVGAKLTQLVGLDDAVSFESGDATRMPFPDGSFDAAWLQHASMNIKGKDELFREIYRVLRPGGRLALHEVLAGPVQPIRFPVPWAREPSFSFLQAERPMRELLRSVGFVEIAWQDTSEAAYGWWRARLAAAESGPPPLGIHLLLGAEAPRMGPTIVRNLEEGRIAVAYGVLDRR